MTTYGPCKRFTIRTLDSIITITGNNMIATVTGFDGGAPLQAGYFITDDSSLNDAVDASKTIGQGSSCVSESSSTVDHQPFPSSDLESVSHTQVSEETPLQCPPNTTASHETAVDRNTSKPCSTMGECGSPSESDQGYTTPSSPISSGTDSINSDSDRKSQLCEASAGLQSIGNKRKCSDGELRETSDLDEREQSLRIRKRIHTTEKPYSCDICGKTFVNSKNMIRHVHTHSGEKPYSCDTCGKTFTRPGNLIAHTRIHTGVKPFLCDTCGKTFTQSWGLTQHVRTHTGEKPYSCDTCGKTFTQPGNLSQHIRTHTGEKPYSCDTCGKTFAKSWGLCLHIRTHTGEKPYSCDTCGKAFTQPGNLSQHVRTHTGEKPYSCDTCGKTFAKSSGLSQHVCTH